MVCHTCEGKIAFVNLKNNIIGLVSRRDSGEKPLNMFFFPISRSLAKWFITLSLTMNTILTLYIQELKDSVQTKF